MYWMLYVICFGCLLYFNISFLLYHLVHSNICSTLPLITVSLSFSLFLSYLLSFSPVALIDAKSWKNNVLYTRAIVVLAWLRFLLHHVCVTRLASLLTTTTRVSNDNLPCSRSGIIIASFSLTSTNTTSTSSTTSTKINEISAKRKTAKHFENEQQFARYSGGHTASYTSAESNSSSNAAGPAVTACAADSQSAQSGKLLLRHTHLLPCHIMIAT